MEYRKLEEIIQFNPTETIKKGTISKKISMDKLDNFKKYVNSFDLEEYKGGAKFKNGDTLFARITPCLENGKTAKVSILGENEIGFGSTEYIVMRKRNNISDEDFIYYLAISPEFRNIAIKSMTGTSGRQRVQLDVLKNTEMLLHSYEEQKKIGKILSSLDEKIELNNKINNNLYEIMKLNFNQWVENIKDYELSNLSSIAYYKNGLAMQKYRPLNELGLPVIKIKEMNSGISSETEKCKSNIDKDVIVNNGDVLFAWSGTLCMTIWSGGKAGLNQHIFKVTSDKYPKWFYYFWTLKYLDNFIQIAAGKATTMGHIKRGELDSSEVLIPNENELKKMNNIMAPMLDKYISNKVENEMLIKLRDTLLPKLMNGEIDLDKIEI